MGRDGNLGIGVIYGLFHLEVFLNNLRAVSV